MEISQTTCRFFERVRANSAVSIATLICQAVFWGGKVLWWVFFRDNTIEREEAILRLALRAELQDRGKWPPAADRDAFAPVPDLPIGRAWLRKRSSQKKDSPDSDNQPPPPQPPRPPPPPPQPPRQNFRISILETLLCVSTSSTMPEETTMAGVDEDTLKNVADDEEDAALDDEVVDYRFLSTVIPKRGEKDFEEHGTALQSNTLAASRQAMHNVLSHKRIHQPKTHTVGHYHPKSNTAYAVNPKGPLFQKMGHVKSVKDDPLGGEERGQRLWFLPEEVLYLIERGTLDVRWPPVDAEDEGVPMSLQGAYAVFIGDEDVLTLERYNVYAALKRMGYTVLRAPSFDGPGPAPGSWCHPPPKVESTTRSETFSTSALGKLLYRPRKQDETAPQSKGSLVQPGLYRDYDTIYRRLSLINFHDPTVSAQPAEQEPPNTDPKFRITYHVWKPGSTTFKKSNPGTPDFRIAVVNARETTAPTLEQLGALMGIAPWDPPKREGKMYAEMKHGYKNVILAVVDQGITSYLRIADAAFGLDNVYERRSQAGGKRGGRGGGRGARGRGRGRGR